SSCRLLDGASVGWPSRVSAYSRSIHCYFSSDGKRTIPAGPKNLYELSEWCPLGLELTMVWSNEFREASGGIRSLLQVRDVVRGSTSAFGLEERSCSEHRRARPALYKF